jgi:hypothetical protein
MLLDRLEQIGGRPLIGKNARRPKATRRGIDPALVSALAPPEPRMLSHPRFLLADAVVLRARCFERLRFATDLPR